MLTCWIISAIILVITRSLAIPIYNAKIKNETTGNTSWTFYQDDDKCLFVVDSDLEMTRNILQAIIYIGFFFTPLIINIVAYTLIVLSLNKSKQKSINPKLILIKAILINCTFTMSWLPYVFVTDIAGVINKASIAVVRVFMYVNSLTDPILYAFSSRAIKLCLLRMERTAKKSLVRRMSTSLGKTVSSRTSSHPKVDEILAIQNNSACMMEQPNQDFLSLNVFLEVQ